MFYGGVYQKRTKFVRGSKYDFHVLLCVLNEDIKSKM